MKKHRYTTHRVFRALLIGAILISLLATTIFAYSGFVLYENPAAMIDAFFGERGQASHEYYETKNEHGEAYKEHGFDRVAVNETLAEKYVQPHTYAIEQTTTLGDYTLTVLTNQYSAAARCGVLYMTLENPNGIDNYEIEYDGSVWWPGETGFTLNDPGRTYLDTANTTETKLSMAVHYAVLDDRDHIRIKMVERENWYTEAVVEVPLYDDGTTAIVTAAEGGLVLSPIGMYCDVLSFPELNRADGYWHFDNIDYVAIRFAGGTEYLLKDNEYLSDAIYDNTAYTCGSEGGKTASYLFNRIVDVEQVTEVVINDIAYPID